MQPDVPSYAHQTLNLLHRNPARNPFACLQYRVRDLQGIALLLTRLCPADCYLQTLVMRRNEREDTTVEPRIAEFLLELIQLVDMVEAEVGSEALGTVRRQLRELDARSAMDALNLLHVITKNCNEEDPNLGELKAAERFLRDVVVMFLVNRVGAAPDRAIFLDTAEDINGTHLDRELKAKLLLAYHKLWHHRGGIWVGDGAADEPRLGEPRRRRRRPRQPGGR